ncbi:MAG TPA: hypothetical protein VFQ39_15575, partial [Longimicrobium sp.]|nr:hypothetical protein [Longimicrobium sp.]
SRIAAIRLANGCTATEGPTFRCPKAAKHPELSALGLPDALTLGAQETIQRWWVDPLPRAGGASGRLGTVFTHDHFGPSTHQQVGLYAGLITEDQGTRWRDPETGTFLGEGPRTDGGPTSWRADILYSDSSKSFREFGLQIADFTFAYGKEGLAGSATPVAINPPGKFEVPLPFNQRPPLAGQCPNGTPAPCPEIIGLDDPGTMSVNYRNEPLALRVRSPGTNTQASAAPGDLSKSFSSRQTRADTRLNTFGPYGQRPGEQPRDPFTPLLRAYEHEKIQVRLLVGAHEEGHNFSISGTRWLFEPQVVNSGWRNSQMAGISEYHEMGLDPLFANQRDTIADFLYVGGAATDDLWNGSWGLIRTYRNRQNNLLPLRGRDFRRLVDGVDRTFAFYGARLDAQMGRKAYPGGYLPEFPDPANAATWEGDATVAYQQTVNKTGTVTNPYQESFTPQQASQFQVSQADTEAGLMPVGGLGEAVVTADTFSTVTDSVSSGYGSESTGGIEYQQFEYDPETGTEYVATADPAVAQKGLIYDAGSTTEFQSQEAAKGAGYANESQAGSINSETQQQAAMMDAAGSGGTVVYSGSSGTNRGFWGICPRVAPIRYYDVTAVSAASAFPNGRITYNSRTTNGGPLVDPSGIAYVFTSDLTSSYTLKAGTPQEPIVLRANAGDCIMVRLSNRVTTPLQDPDGWNTLPIIVDKFNANQVDPSPAVGLHPQLVAYDVQRSDGSMVGVNDSSIVAPGRYRWYQWYAGDVSADPTRSRLVSRGIEFGATNLIPADRIKHPNKGAIGALIIEP